MPKTKKKDLPTVLVKRTEFFDDERQVDSSHVRYTGKQLIDNCGWTQPQVDIHI